jgi:hypothetical protein
MSKPIVHANISLICLDSIKYFLYYSSSSQAELRTKMNNNMRESPNWLRMRDGVSKGNRVPKRSFGTIEKIANDNNLD